MVTPMERFDSSKIFGVAPQRQLINYPHVERSKGERKNPLPPHIDDDALKEAQNWTFDYMEFVIKPRVVNPDFDVIYVRRSIKLFHGYGPKDCPNFSRTRFTMVIEVQYLQKSRDNTQSTQNYADKVLANHPSVPQLSQGQEFLAEVDRAEAEIHHTLGVNDRGARWDCEHKMVSPFNSALKKHVQTIIHDNAEVHNMESQQGRRPENGFESLCFREVEIEEYGVPAQFMLVPPLPGIPDEMQETIDVQRQVVSLWCKQQYQIIKEFIRWVNAEGSHFQSRGETVPEMNKLLSNINVDPEALFPISVERDAAKWYTIPVNGNYGFSRDRNFIPIA
ncbi:hypothetical protein G7Y89_g12960 [Cudoniella acicularis]|uniref:Uncharacterized protein n=1 Tax=Cudoniella acicularis TaxID=354080 RepID=A0A8H4RAJ1_9HELO|nr:hypothetical protein G7Y89_g12960 [Cudoniella acicularis]